MSSLGQTLLWCVIQVAAICVSAIVVARLVSRRNPAAGVWCLRTGIVLALVITLTAHLSLPSWFAGNDITAASVPLFTGNPQPTANPLDGTPLNLSSDQTHQRLRPVAKSEVATYSNRSADTEDAPASLMSHVRDAFRQTISQSSVLQSTDIQSKTESRISPLAWAILSTVGIGLIWFLVGLIAVGRLLRRSDDIDDPRATESLDVVMAELSCNRRIRLAEVELASAATVGFFRPVVLLPGTWYDWSDQELQAVLAHEVAHVTTNDFGATVLSQLVVAIHFFHPLVHLLTRQLRITQELAADASASGLAGGRAEYATVLAGMALRTNRQSILWATQAFLPAPRTLLRRIEMLRDTDNLKTKVSRTGRLLITSTLLLVTCAVAGLRANPWQPVEPAKPLATPTPILPAESPSLSLDWIPNGSLCVAAIKPAEFLQHESIKPVAESLRRQAQQTGLNLNEIDSITVCLADENHVTFIIRSRRANGWSVLRQSLGDTDKSTFENQTIYGGKSSPAWFTPDASTLVIDHSPGAMQVNARSIQHVVRMGRHGTSNRYWHEQWKGLSDKPAALLLDLGAVRESSIAAMPQQAVPGVAFDRKYSPLGQILGESVYRATSPIWDKGEILAASLIPGEQISLQANMTTVDEADAKRIHETTQAAFVLFRNMMLRQQRSLARSRSPETAAFANLIEIAQQILSRVRIIRVGPEVQFTATASKDEVSRVMAGIAPIIAIAQTSNRSSMSTNNLKQIMLGLHNYHSFHKRLPPAYSMGKDGNGKHPVSWRVLITPFIDQADIFKKYHFDEPWDSPHNKEVTSTMPRVFAHPNTPLTNVNSSYFGVVSSDPKSLCGFGRHTGNRFSDFTDGMSNSLMVVEANRNIHWAKPEDLEWDTRGALPEFGGFQTGEFLAGRADGSVSRFRTDADAAELKKLLTIADGQKTDELKLRAR